MPLPNLMVFVHPETRAGNAALSVARWAQGELSDAEEWAVSSAPAAAQAAARQLAAYVGTAPLAAFDASALQRLMPAPTNAAARRLLGRIIDLRDLALLAWPTATRLSPAALLDHVGVAQPTPEPRPALLADLYQALLQRFRDMDLYQLRDLAARMAVPTWPARTILEGVLVQRRGQRARATSYADLIPRAPRRRERAEPREVALEAQAIAAELGPEGPVARSLPSYQRREGQMAMAQAVCEALSRSEILCVEAGTGVGKSLAYLLPAVRWALATGHRVVISTNTKSLQDQLVYKDIPLLQQALGEQFAAASVKGRANYACVRKVMARAQDAEGSLFERERLETAFLLAWLVESDTGDLDELGADALQALEGLGQLINHVRSDSLSCLGRGCPWRASCTVERVRRQAHNADLIVANHALVLAATEAPVLPEYQHLVVDEAHNFEAVATDQFGLEFSRPAAQWLLRSLQGSSGRGGLLTTATSRLERCSAEERAGKVLGLLDQADQAAGQVQSSLAGLSEQATDFLFGSSAADKAAGQALSQTRRLTDEVREQEAWAGVERSADLTLRAFNALAQSLAEAAAGVADFPEGSLADRDGLARDLSGAAMQCQQQAAALAAILGGDDHDTVSWIEGSQRPQGSSWAMRLVPVSVAEHLKQAIYEANRTVVFTSATLTVDQRFDFLHQRLGLDEVAGRTQSLTVSSPFRLQEQLLLCVPDDLPAPGHPDYLDCLSEAILAVGEAVGGGALVLFTARSTMLEAHQRLAPRFRKLGLDLFCQEVSGPRSDLLERLRQGPDAVLFGLKSFWEGVDVPGPALRCVIVTKLPFAVPDDPVIEARREHLEARGVDSRNEFYIPLAIIGLRQGVGRLIRTIEDRGVVFLLDSRVLRRPYGRRFLNSLGECAFAAAGLQQCLAAAREWLVEPGLECKIP